MLGYILMFICNYLIAYSNLRHIITSIPSIFVNLLRAPRDGRCSWLIVTSLWLVRSIPDPTRHMFSRGQIRLFEFVNDNWHGYSQIGLFKFINNNWHGPSHLSLTLQFAVSTPSSAPWSVFCQQYATNSSVMLSVALSLSSTLSRKHPAFAFPFTLPLKVHFIHLSFCLNANVVFFPPLWQIHLVV